MKEKVLAYLVQNKGKFVSGEKISENIGISRAAVWKHISSLRGEGFEIESASRRGYMLKGDVDIISAQIIKELLSTKIMGSDIICMESVDSTNDYLKSIAIKAGEGTVVIAQEQTMGKGRMGKHWHAKRGEGIWMSLLLRPLIMPSKASIMTQIAGAAVVKALDEMGIKAMIKWPNDIMLNGKKLCGILTEMGAELDRIDYIIIGIGINVNMKSFPEELAQIATSIAMQGYKVKRNEIIAAVLQNFEELYTKYVEELDLSETLDICKKRSTVIGRDIYIINWSGRRKAKAIDIGENGELLVENENGEIETVFSGEVSIRKAEDVE